MNILYVTSEAVPFCKTGGLADVAGSLPQALAANGDRVSVILPLYERGSFKKVKDSMVTGVTDADEPHAIAVIGAKYDKKSVVFRIAFDPEMNLIGLDVRGK